MSHPYSKDVHSSHKSKTHSMGHSNNLVIPVMRAAGENRAGGIHESSNTMQHKKQSAADGMKRGGHVKHHKSKMPMVVPAAPVAPPSTDPALAAAGAASSPAPAPMPGAPPAMKRGGRHTDEASDKALIKKMVKPEARKMAHGGRSYPLDAGSKSGIGRLEKNHMGKPPFKPIRGSGE